MNQSSTISKIATALVRAQSEMKAAQKSGDNKFDKYRYSKLEDFYDAAKPILSKHGLALVIGNPVVAALPDRPTKNGGLEHACQVQVEVMLLHESGEWMSTVGHGEGQDRADKSIYKALTGAKKYAVAGLLAIPTTDDPEADETVGGSRVKHNSAGEIVTKKPSWSDDQKKRAGAAKAAYVKAGGQDSDMDDVWRTHAYDPPETCILAMNELAMELDPNFTPESPKE